MFASKDVFLKSTGGYTIARSVRFRSSASANLNRTYAGTGTSATIKTLSMWVKRGTLGSAQRLANSNAATAGTTYFRFNASDNLDFQWESAGSTQLVTTQVFRDPSSWYHIVLALDSTQATASNRVKIYVNGVQVTSFGTTNYPAQNATTSLFGFASAANRIGCVYDATSEFFDGYMAEINHVDGQALTPSSFGAISTNGVWQPARYTGTYGTNGFYLKFADNSTAAALGTDSSGNSNTWTVNNISITAGATYDSMTDVPTLTSATAANYADWNPITQPYTNITRTTVDGNLNSTLASSGAGGAGTFSTIAMATGSWYAEFTVLQIAVGTNLDIGILRQDQLASIANGTFGAIGYSPYGYSCYQPSGAYANNNTSSTSGTSYTTNDIVQVAFNASTGKLWFGKNGTFMSSGDPAAGTNPAFSSIPSNSYVFAFGLAAGATGRTVQVVANFGQRPFTYTAPTGFVALNTYNLSTPTIANGAGYMAATLYTGNNSTLAVTNTVNGVSMQPDLLWLKTRSGGGTHVLYDSVRGNTKFINSNTTAADTTQGAGTGLTSFNSNGFTLAADILVGAGTTNSNGITFVAWQWYTNGGSTASNTSGSITSTVSAGTTQGFSVVTYTGTGANATVGHGLGVAPSMVIVKGRSNTFNWGIWHTAFAGTDYVLLNLTNAKATLATIWNSTVPTSSVISVGTDVTTNQSSATYVAYCFAAVAGYSAFGSYTGNGSTDGPFVYLGFRPRWVMVKRTDATSDWYIWDTTRDTYNVVAATLLADTLGAETSATSIDDLSNGFKCRSATVVNVSTGTYIYAAFAENPFKYSLAR